MERETPGQRPRPNYGHPHPGAELFVALGWLAKLAKAHMRDVAAVGVAWGLARLHHTEDGHDCSNATSADTEPRPEPADDDVLGAHEAAVLAEMLWVPETVSGLVRRLFGIRYSLMRPPQPVAWTIRSCPKRLDNMTGAPGGCRARRLTAASNPPRLGYRVAPS